MSTLSQFLAGSEQVASLVGTPSFAGNIPTTLAPAASATTTLSGALTASTLKTALSVSGRGRVQWLALYSVDATSRTLQMRITVDGTVIRNFTSGAFATTNAGYVCLGGGNSSSAVYQPIKFNSSLLVEIASSLTETDKVGFAYVYETFA